MTDRCAPPDGSPSGEYWVEYEGTVRIVLRWRHDLAAWWFMGAWRTPDEIHFTAVRYLRPCRPDDAEARERLHRWVMSMMPTLNAMAAEDMGMDDCRDAIDIVSEIAAELQLPDGWDDDTLMEALRNAR